MLLAVWHVWSLAIRSADPRQYFDRGDPAISSWEYPTVTVVAMSLLLLVEGAVVWLVLFSPGAQARWRRALLGVVLTSPPTFLAFLMISSHRPPYVAVHTTWLFELTVIALITLAISVVGAIVSRSRRKTLGD